MKTYEEVLEFLYTQLPMFQRQGAAAYKANLDNTINLCKILNNPQNSFPSIHIAGTNGKGSTSNMIASVFQKAGYKTGLYTSPHLVDFRERIRVNGEMITKSYVIDFVNKYSEAFIPINPSFFEITFAMAIQYFKEQNVDIAIMETGMGGRLDSTNVVKSELSIITNISKDHTAFLGNTLEKIAIEKAGIIKQNIPVIIGERQEETTEVFLKQANLFSSKISWANDFISVDFEDFEGKTEVFVDNKSFIKINFPLKGKYQENNLKTAVAALISLQKKWNLSIENISKGLENILTNTGFAGRWQIIKKNPTLILDTGHNVAGLTLSMKQLAETNYSKLHFVLGVVNDKEIDEILKLLPIKATYYFCKANIPRALDAEILYQQATKNGLIGKKYNSVKEALEVALLQASQTDLVFVGGSTFVVAEALE